MICAQIVHMRSARITDTEQARETRKKNAANEIIIMKSDNSVDSWSLGHASLPHPALGHDHCYDHIIGRN